MKKSKKSLIMWAILLVMILTGTAIYGQSRTARIDVTYRDIKLNINGVNFPVSGDVEPFVYNGRTYVPLGIVSQALGYEVSWDANTNTVIIGSPGQTPPVITPTPTPQPPSTSGQKLIDILPPYTITYSNKYYTSSASDGVKLGGTTYKNSFSIQVPINPQYAAFNFDGRYRLLTGIIGTTDGQTRDAVVEFIADDKVIKIFEIKGGSIPQSFSIDVTGVRQFTVRHTGNGGTVGLAELIIY